MDLELNPRQWLSKTVNNTEEFVDLIKKADGVCQNCKPISPVMCIESCEIWKLKNEFLEMNGLLCAGDYIPNLLNAVKNNRRQKVIAGLYERPRTLKDLQEFLKRSGYYHSQHTIAKNYVEPLLKTGLITQYGNKYRLTVYGQKLRDALHRFTFENTLPIHSNCNEEKVLKKLMADPKTYTDLVESSTQKDLPRSLKRLTDHGLVTKSKTREYVFYFKTKKVPKKEFSPTEKRVYEAIPDVGIPATLLTKEVGINLRRIYKYLRRLKSRRLVFTRKKPRTYELTASGKRLARFLEETENLVLNASKASTFLLERSR